MNARGLFPPLKNGEEGYRTPGYKEPALLQGAVEQPCRKTAALTSRFRHQDEGGTPARTPRENTVEGGGEMLDFTGAKAAGVFFERNGANIPNCALRKELSLRNSGNRVEKASGQAVANRQKHSGMSWSKCGSITRAELTTVVMNGETRNWLDRGGIDLKLAS